MSPSRWAVSALVAALGAVTLVATGSPASAAGTFVNPVSIAADPYLLHHNGRYYNIEVNSSTTGINARSAASVADLWTATPQPIWSDTDNSRNKQIWAPSVLNLNDRWYLYYTASDGVDANHRNYVAESTGLVSQGATPAGPYRFKAKIEDGANSWAIDGLPFQHNGGLYYAWAGVQNGQWNNMFVARMSNPWTLNSGRVHLPLAGSCPTIREAPSFLRYQGRTWMVYSTCDTGLPDYSLWATSIWDGQDPLNAGSWQQRQGAVFSRNDAANVFGPGHNSFFKSPDGTEDWIAYHAKTTAAYTYANRDTRIQKISWNPDGSPNLGRPVALNVSMATPSGDPGPSRAPVASRIIGPAGKCVDVAGDDNGANWSAVQLWDCQTASRDQQWTWSGTQLKSLGRCLDVDGNSTQMGALVHLWDCNGVGGQQWYQRSNGALYNPRSGYCLDSPNGATANGTRLRIWDCNGAAAQVFRKQ